MSIDASQIGDLFLSLAALAGLLVLHGLIVTQNPEDPLNRRFLFGLRVMGLLFGARALLVLTGWMPFRFFILLAAALVPLCVLLMTEGLLRRHAPRPAKLYLASGTALFTVLAFWWGPALDPARLIGLMVFQFSGFLIGGALVLGRDRESLTAAENRAVERLALSLVVLMPLAVADFLIRVIDLPAQISPLGVLVLCWLAVTLGRGQNRHRSVGMDLLALVSASGLCAAAVIGAAGLGRDAAIVCTAVILATVLIVALVLEARSLSGEARSHTLLRHLADDRSRDLRGFLSGFQAHPLVEGAVLIDAGHLAELDIPVLKRLFALRPILRRADPPFHDGVEGDHFTHLFDLYAASHILLVDDKPLTLVALSMPALATSPRAELELAVVQRMARLMGRGASEVVQSTGRPDGT